MTDLKMFDGGSFKILSSFLAQKNLPEKSQCHINGWMWLPTVLFFLSSRLEEQPLSLNKYYETRLTFIKNRGRLSDQSYKPETNRTRTVSPNQNLVEAL